MKILFILIIFFVIAIAGIRVLEHRTMFYPSRSIERTPGDIGLNFDDVYFKTEDNVTLNGWFIPAENSKSTLFFTHGNAGNISHRLEKILLFNRMGLNVFIFDYRGYGKSSGIPSEKGLYKDTMAGYEYLTKKYNISPDSIISYGASLGGALAIDIASKKGFCGLIADSTFSSAKDMAQIIVPFVPSFLIGVNFNSIEKVKEIKIPKLFIHGDVDEIVPFELGKKLYDAAAFPKTFLKLHCDHNNTLLRADLEFMKGINEFLKELNRQVN